MKQQNGSPRPIKNDAAASVNARKQQEWNIAYMDYLTFILGLWTAFLGAAWPIAIIALVLLYRREIPRFFNRVAQLWHDRDWRLRLPGGVEAQSQRIQEKPIEGVSLAEEDGDNDTSSVLQENANAINVPSTASDLEEIPPSGKPSIDRRDELIYAQLQALEPHQQIPRLVRGLAHAQATLTNEWVYNRIWGSQITFMQTLAALPAITEAMAKQHYDRYVAQFPTIHNPPNFPLWLQWLINQLMIEPDGSGHFSITDYGRDFLAYIGESGLRYDRIG